MRAAQALCVHRFPSDALADAGLEFGRVRGIDVVDFLCLGVDITLWPFLGSSAKAELPVAQGCAAIFDGPTIENEEKKKSHFFLLVL